MAPGLQKRVGEALVPGRAAQHARAAVQLSQLVVGQRPHCSHGDPPDWNGVPAGSPYTVAVEESRDDGRSWNIISAFPVPEDARMLSYDEPHLVELEDGKLIVLFRDCIGQNFMRQADVVRF